MKTLKDFTMDKDANRTKGKRFCPLTDNPELDCYINDLKRLNISFALHYCQGDFETCPIYQKFIKI
jgi:hypothetical protein